MNELSNHKRRQWERRMVRRADEMLRTGAPLVSARRGSVVIVSVDLNVLSDRGWRPGGHDTHKVKRRPAVVWNVHDWDAGEVWDVVPVSSNPQENLSLADGIVDFDDVHDRTREYLVPRLVRLHPSAVSQGAVVGTITESDAAALAQMVAVGDIVDVRAWTGDRETRFRDQNGKRIWTADAALEELRRRRTEMCQPTR